jgi:hypothetical protein
MSTRPKKAGWIYILENPAYPGVVKIGKTARSPDGRARAHSLEHSYEGAWEVSKVFFNEFIPISNKLCL